MSFARVVGVTVLMLTIALIPLSTVITPGEFEVHFQNHGASFELDFTASLADRTGLVRGLAATQPTRSIDSDVSNLGAEQRTLIVDLVGSSCDMRTHLALEPRGSEFVLHVRTESGNCAIGTGMTRAVAISLWEPIDAARVRIEATK